MSVARFTLLPQPDAVTPVVAAPAADPVVAPVEVVSIARMARGGRWRTEAMRSYDRPVLVWFTRGQGRLTVAGRSGGYGPNNMIFLPPKTMHGFSTGGQVLGSVVFLPYGLDWPGEVLHLRFRDVRPQRELTAMIDAMEREFGQGGALAHRALAHHAGLLAVWLKRTADAWRESGDAPAPPPSGAHRLAEAFAALIERDFRQPEGVQHYAALLGVTPTHLTRVCRKVSGRAALDILTDRRHFEARRLLKDTAMPVAEIARVSGFRSAAYFARAFRARSGQSPSAFRRAR